MMLPEGTHCVRLCGRAGLGDNGEILASVFAPHEGNELRPPDQYLSVHWLEYLINGGFTECLAKLRSFLLVSPIKNERIPTRNGKLAVIPCTDIRTRILEEFNYTATVSHVPRPELHEPACETIACGFTVDLNGSVTYGLASEQGDITKGIGLDPHSGIFIDPENAARFLAVQQLLASLVVYTEPGKI